MISIIICSRKRTLPIEFLEHIATTIGIDHELVVIDNSKNKYSIFEAYNLGIKQSKGDYWCFIHDDILFHTQDWGLKIKNIFKTDSKIGLIGVAGAKVKTKMPSAWWDCDDGDKVIYIRQHLDNNKIENWNIGWNQSSIQEVVVIDGVFMAGRPNDSICFDENLIGFHNYDISLSIAYKSRNFKVVVTNLFLIEHFSLGTINSTWCETVVKFDLLYRNMLPMKTENSIKEKRLKQLEFKNGKLFCEKLVANNFKKQAVFYWFRLILLKPISKFHYKFIKIIFK